MKTRLNLYRTSTECQPALAACSSISVVVGMPRRLLALAFSKAVSVAIAAVAFANLESHSYL